MNSATSRIVSILLIICVGTSLLTIGFHMINQKYKTETAIIATAENSAVFKGVYIRDEELVKYGGNGAVSYCVSDGGKLGSGSVIAEIYSDESQIDIKEKISSLKNELSVLKKIRNPGTLKSAQPANIAGLIDEKYKNVVYGCEQKNLSDLSARKEELLILLSTYQLVTDSNSKSSLDGRISAINSEITKLEASESVPLDTIVSNHSAYFVSYADGYEDKLNVGSLGNITPEMINEVKDSGPVKDGNVIGKLINSYEWYIAGIMKDGKENFSVEDDVKIKLQSTSDMAKGTIYDIREAGKDGESLVIIKCDEVTHDLVQHRSERVEMISIDGESKGIKVPRKAIRFQDVEETEVDEKTGKKSTKSVNAKGVYVKLGERISFKRIDIIYEDSDYVLSSLNAGNGYLALYDDIVVEGVDDDGN